MRVVFAGASGFLGTHLRERLAAAGHEVVQLVRRPPAEGNERRWRPDQGELDQAILADADAVINLAGVGPGDKRWTKAYKRLIVTSRINTTRTIARTLAAMPADRRPRVFLNASGIQIYGDHADVLLSEQSPHGSGFMEELCQAWEAATEPAAQAGVRVVRLRTGPVLDSSGGMFRLQVLVFRLFAGGKMGNGRQWMSWITLHDWLSAVAFLLERDDIAGPVNLVGPHPVRNVDYTKALGRALHRPTIFPTPRFGVRLVIGKFGTEAMASIRVAPAVLTRAGFSFSHTDLDAALRAALH